MGDKVMLARYGGGWLAPGSVGERDERVCGVKGVAV